MRRRGFVIHYLPAFVMLIRIFSIVHGQYFEAPANERNSSHKSALYILGDSSVDCGDNTLFYPLLHGRLSLYPCNGSDATLLPQLLAEKIGLTSIRPFYGQNGSMEEVLGGLNFGSTQATIMNPGSHSHQSLNQQLRQVSETMQLLQLQLSEDAALQYTKSSIFFLSFGKEDYIDLFLQNSSSQMFKHGAPYFATILVDQMINAARYLYDANARKIICLGILPLGCTPRIVWESKNHTSAVDYNGNGCVEQVNEFVFEYNRLMDERIAKLNTEFPDAHMVFCDVYKGMMEIINKPRFYGFEDVKSACCGLGLNGAIIGCISMDMACDEASTHVWWDLLNPTEAVNSILADAAWSGQPIPGLCNPITIHELVKVKVKV
ncbi:GDSL esterase/lipase At1g71250-like [Gastrolobium bilobum]|uniref:GDSL esterase/lipase At1g71250-like n=1 Tax=Gastrolobium bilobum TaxID=150636 RepID=UPI002AB0DDB2|nr:GDSL esterase/lipase At1g71250-like [Gastrolobium bilobum]